MEFCVGLVETLPLLVFVLFVSIRLSGNAAFTCFCFICFYYIITIKKKYQIKLQFPARKQ